MLIVNQKDLKIFLIAIINNTYFQIKINLAHDMI